MCAQRVKKKKYQIKVYMKMRVKFLIKMRKMEVWGSVEKNKEKIVRLFTCDERKCERYQ